MAKAETIGDRFSYPWRILTADSGLLRFADNAPRWSEESYPMWRSKAAAEVGIAFMGLGGAKAVPWPTHG